MASAVGEFRQDLDYAIWVGSHEELFLWEFLWDHRAEWPDMPDAQARSRLQAKLIELLELGHIGLQAEPWSKPEERRELDRVDAVAAVRDERNWNNTSLTDWCYSVIPLSKSYETWPLA
ncbi:MAG: hypothetical protein ACKVXR_15740 [Planctomycetota bacterium]